MDVAIASIALELRGSVATCNLRHFERVPDLVVEDWSTR
jgi:predicted nucleic acid-binding protein